MGWVILFLVLLAAAFGVLGAVIKVAAFLVLTILLVVAALAAIAWYSFKGQLRRWERDGRRRRGPGVDVVLAARVGATPGPPVPRRPLLGPKPHRGRDRRRASRRPSTRNNPVKASPTAMNTRILTPVGDPTISVRMRSPMGTATIQFLRRLRQPGLR